MDTIDNASSATPAKENAAPAGAAPEVELTPLQLNSIKLDVTHTVLTPEYLEKLKEGSQG